MKQIRSVERAVACRRNALTEKIGQSRSEQSRTNNEAAGHNVDPIEGKSLNFPLKQTSNEMKIPNQAVRFCNMGIRSKEATIHHAARSKALVQAHHPHLPTCPRTPEQVRAHPAS